MNRIGRTLAAVDSRSILYPLPLREYLNQLVQLVLGLLGKEVELEGGLQRRGAIFDLLVRIVPC